MSKANAFCISTEYLPPFKHQIAFYRDLRLYNDISFTVNIILHGM